MDGRSSNGGVSSRSIRLLSTVILSLPPPTTSERGFAAVVATAMATADTISRAMARLAIAQRCRKLLRDRPNEVRLPPPAVRACGVRVGGAAGRAPCTAVCTHLKGY